MKRILLLMLLSITTSIALSQTTWTGLGANTNWNNTDNWDTNLVPTALDDVVIPTGFTVTLNVAATINSIDIQGSTIFNMNNNLSPSQPSNIGSNVTFNWNSGTMLGGSSLTNAGTINIFTSNTVINGATTLNNNGILNLNETGDLIIGTNSVVNNNADGIIDFKGNNGHISITGAAPRTLNNMGLIKTSFADPAWSATIFAEFKNNDGTIQVESGTLNLLNSTVDAIELIDGTYNIFPNAALDFDSVVTLLGTLSGSVDGTINSRGNTYVNSGTSATLDFSGAAIFNWVSGNFIGGGNLINESNIITGGSNVTLNGATTLTNNGSIELSGAGDIIISTNSVLNNTALGTIDFQGDNSAISIVGAAPRTLINQGSISVNLPDATSNATIFSEFKNNNGTIGVESGILNLSNGTTDAIELTDGIYNVSADATLDFENAVTVLGTLTGTLDGDLNWRNTINVNSGESATLNFNGTQAVSWIAGTLLGGGTLNNQSTIETLVSNVTINGATTLNNTGTFGLTESGDVIIGTNSVFNNLAAGTVEFTGPNSAISITGAAPRLFNNEGLVKMNMDLSTSTASIFAEFTNSGTIQIESGNLNINNGIVDAVQFTNGVYNVFADGNLNFQGSITLSGTLTGNSDGAINSSGNLRVNAPNTAILDLDEGSSLSWNFGNFLGGGTFVNNMEINVAASNVTINGATTLNNNENLNLTGAGDIIIGTNSIINNLAGGIIDLQGDNSVLSITGATPNTVNNQGLLRCTAPNIAIIGAQLVNTGTIDAASGTLFINGIFDNQVGGIAKGVSNLNLPTITNFTNDGTFAPGGSPGTLIVVGNYTSTANTIFEVELNGLTPDTEHDVMAITGTSVVFEGSVNVTMGFEGTVGDEFTIATTSGTIATANLQSPIENVDFDGKRYTFEVSYPDNNKVVLAITEKLDILPPNIITQDIIVQLDANGNVSITDTDVDNGTTDNCTPTNELQFSLDITDFTCADLGDNTVTLTVTDNDGNFAEAQAIVTVEDVTNPNVVTQNITVQLDASGNASILPSNIDDGSNDNCSVANLSLDVSDFTCSELGANTVNLTVTDQSGNSDSASAIVTVEDVTNPTAITQNITVQLDASGNASILPSDIDDGSSDNCLIANLSLDVSDFDCSNLGANTVTLTVTDTSGNTNSETALVTVEDLISPTASTQDITVQLDASGNASILASDINNGSSDNCSIANLSLDVSDFDCSNLGTNTVNLTVTDQSGNSSSGSATVTVVDILNPTVVTQDITVQLDASGNASITANNIDDGSSDNCSIVSLVLDITDFTCSNLGANTVNLTVIDQSGNSASASATVTVADMIAPQVVCPEDMSIETVEDYEIPNYFNLGEATATDNCTDPITNVVQSPVPGTLVSDGDYEITITVTDASGNESSCTFNLHVDKTLGVDDLGLTNSQIMLYPNPVKDVLTLKNQSRVRLDNVEIIDITGKIIQQIDLSNMDEAKTITLSNYASGVYYLRVNAQGTTITKKIIKQ